MFVIMFERNVCMTFYLLLQNVFDPYLTHVFYISAPILFVMALQMDVLLPLLPSFALHLEGAQNMSVVYCSHAGLGFLDSSLWPSWTRGTR